MTAKTIFAYLLGSRPAILDIAAHRHAVWLGLLFVLAAGFAREYDGEDLMREPWHPALPLVASLATSLLLFVLVWGAARLRGVREGSFGSVYRSFLGLYWMTAPLALLYAIPVERFLSAGQATRVNLCLLGVVSIWRVALMTRVVSVMFNASAAAAFCLVMLFADSVALFLLTQTPLPVFAIMGGVRLTESEQVIQTTAFFVTFVGAATWPIWLIGALVAAFSRKCDWSLATAGRVAARPISPAAWSLGLVSLVMWAPLLYATQPEQQLRWKVERSLRQGRIDEAIAVMSAHRRSDFPPHWDPPPRVGYGETEPPLIEILESMETVDAKPWVRRLFLEKYQDHLGDSLRSRAFWAEMPSDQLLRHLAVLHRIPGGRAILDEQRERLTWALESSRPRSQAEQEQIQALLSTDSTPPIHPSE